MNRNFSFGISNSLNLLYRSYANQISRQLFHRFTETQSDQLDFALSHPTYHADVIGTSQKYPKALIIASCKIEQAFLKQSMVAENFAVDQVFFKQDLFKLIKQHNDYDVIVISESFKELGPVFLCNYFKMTCSHPKFVYLGDHYESAHAHIGFSATLNNLSTPQEIAAILV